MDEAYTLTVPESEKDFGREAVDELMKDLLSGDPVRLPWTGSDRS